MERLKHKLDPIYDKKSKLLILGTFPSPKSREINFYYTHPQNRFWKVLGNILNIEIPKDNGSRIKILYKYNIAIWDVIRECDISGSKDSSIRNVIPNDIVSLINKTNIKYIVTTGNKAYELYNKYLYSKTKIEAIKLPSTSPANARMNVEKLTKEYSIIKDLIG
ncbi:MAG: DNA-deoxyinosine glycosylase [Tissierellia bacterium]|nr:DNA-deoxyinosine glycosylase [Tissierellia bacterium]